MGDWRSIEGNFVALAKCPVGLFWSESGELCLKTEYGDNNGRIDAYIVASGEFFWGQAPQTIENQRKQMVRPVAFVSASAGPPSMAVREKTIEECAKLVDRLADEADAAWRNHSFDIGARAKAKAISGALRALLRQEVKA